MHTNHRIARALRAIVMVLFILALTCPQPALAQAGAPEDPRPPRPGGAPGQGSEFDPLTGQTLQTGPLATNNTAAVILAAGGPDYYGYTWTDTNPYSWIDARSGGTNTGINNNQCWPNSYALPFSFKFYENVYTSVYIARNGYMTFTDGGWCDSQSRVPDVASPNNVIAPYWSPLSLGGGVYYKSGGTAPNRYFVVEWYQMNGYYANTGTYTFEAILYENGNIVLQYQAMNYPSGTYYCGGAGIEDMRGMDGLEINWCSQIASLKAYTFTRPAPTSRVLVYPHAYGAFAGPGELASFTLPLKNIGDAGSDTFDLSPACAWPVTFQNANTRSPLVDTNGNGMIDTGSVAQGATFPVLVQVQMPWMGSVGTNASCFLNVIPARNPSKSRDAAFGAAVPAPFAEVDGTSNGAMNLSIIEPLAQVNKSYAGGTYGYLPAVAETPTGNFVYAWSQGRCSGTNCSSYYEEIYFMILDKTGGVVKDVTRLADLSGLDPYTYDEYPAIAVAPDGTIGIAFTRSRFNNSGQGYINAYLARLNAAGTLLGIANLTNYSVFRSYSDTNLVRIYDPAIAATSDSRFTVAWETYQFTPTGSLDNIVTGVWNTGGGQVAAPAAITVDTTANNDGYYSPNLAASGTNVVVVYMSSYEPDIYYQVRNSAGSLVKGAADLTNNYNYEARPDVVRLSDGRFLVAWDTFYAVQYTILDGAYNPIVPVQTLNSLSESSMGRVSLAADQDGHGILSWINLSNDRTIYYALVNSAGQLLTDTMAMKSSPDTYQIGYTGNNITSHAVTAPTTNQVDLYLKGMSPFPVIPSTTGTLKVELGNLGMGMATNITMTMTIPSGITVGMPSPAANCVANTCTWSFTGANLGFMGKGVISIPVTMGSVPPGTAYDLTLTIASPEADPYQSNNMLTITVVSGYQLSLPAVMR